MDGDQNISFASVMISLTDGLLWFFKNLAFAVVNIAYSIGQPNLWLDWSDKKAIMRFVYFGGSVEFFFSVLLIFLKMEFL